MYSGYDYYVIKTADMIEFRDPNTGFTQRFIEAGGSFIPAPGVKYRALITEATATHITIRQPGGFLLRFEITGYVQNGAHTRCRLLYQEDLNGNRVTFSYALPATNTTANVMKWTEAVDPYGRTTTFTYTTWNGKNVISRVTFPDGRTVDYTYNADNARFFHKVSYGTGGVASGIESTWYATSTVKVNEALLPADHYFWEVKLNATTYGRVRSFKRFDGNYVYARSVTDEEGLITTTTWDQNVVKQVKRARGKQLVSSRKQQLDGTWETEIDYTANNYLPPTAYVEPASGGVPARTTSVTRDAATDMVTSRTYADATSETYNYNAFNQMTRFIDRGGDEETWTYDASGNLLTHTVAVGTAIEADEHWTYNARGQVLTYEDFNGNVTTYEYYAAAHPDQFELEKIVLPNGPGQPAGEITFTYDDFGRIETTTDPAGRTVSFEYDEAGRHIKTTYADTSTETTTYGTGANSARVLETKDRNGNRTVYTYDNTGRVETVEILESGSNDLMQVVTNTYDLPTGLLTATDTDGDTTEFQYDYKNRVTHTTVHPSATKSLTRQSIYNRYRLETTIDYYGRDTDYTYDNLDRILSRTVELTPGGATITTSTEYDDEGLVTATIDGNGNRDEYTYDARDRRTETTFAVGSPVEASTSTAYDDNSNVITRTDERNHDWVTTYTVRNRVLTDANPEGDTTSYTYTADTLVATVTNANGHTTTNTYEACCARLEKQTDDDGFFKTFEYDFKGNLTQETDESGRVTTYEYDGLDRVTERPKAARHDALLS